MKGDWTEEPRSWAGGMLYRSSMYSLPQRSPHRREAHSRST